MSEWLKVRCLPELQSLICDAKIREERKPPHWLLVRKGVFKTSYRIEYRKNGVTLRNTLGEFPSWEKARDCGEKLIAERRYQINPEPKAAVRCETLCKQLIDARRDMSKSTHEGARIHFENHIIPFLNEHAPYVHQLTANTYRNYRAYKRAARPDIAIYNHWKHFVMLYRYAFEEGYMPKKITLKQEDRKKPNSDEDEDQGEDFEPELKKLISKDHLQFFLKHANQAWQDRAIIQRYTGMRPSEVRKLRKNRVNFQTGEIHLRGRDTKTGEPRSFRAPPEVMMILRRLKLASKSPFFFPNEVDPKRPMTPTMKSWHSAWRRSGTDAGYTPHCLRHTYLTEMFKSGQNPTIICYAAGLSLEEAQKTYLHFTAEDTQGVAEEASQSIGLA